MKYSIITTSFNQLEMIKKAKTCWDTQTFKDFEWIIADDGSSDETIKWCEKNKIKYVTHVHEGYKHFEIIKKAIELARGENLVWVMGDSYPKTDFLEHINNAMAEDRIVGGLRINVDQEGRVISPDWRVDRVLFDLDQKEVQIIYPQPWQYMTLNSMCMPRRMYHDLGGFFDGYKGYGRNDWDIVMRAFFANVKLFWAPRAVICHKAHPETAENQDNIKLFDERLEQFQKKSKKIRK